MATLTVSTADKVCRVCGAEIQKEITRCDKCNLPYHSNCLKKKKRCSSRSPSPSYAISLTKYDLPQMLADQLKKISLQIDPIQTTLDEVSQRVNNIEGSISTAMARVDTLDSEVQGIKTDMISLNN